jgi:hypothetical protein
MNNQSGNLLPNNPTNVQNWYVKDNGTPGLDVTLTLNVVNPIEAGFHTITIFDSTDSIVVGPIELEYQSFNNPSPSPTADVSTTLSVPGAGAGDVYRVELAVEGDQG